MRIYMHFCAVSHSSNNVRVFLPYMGTHKPKLAVKSTQYSLTELTTHGKNRAGVATGSDNRLWSALLTDTAQRIMICLSNQTGFRNWHRLKCNASSEYIPNLTPSARPPKPNCIYFAWRWAAADRQATSGGVFSCAFSDIIIMLMIVCGLFVFTTQNTTRTLKGIAGRSTTEPTSQPTKKQQNEYHRQPVESTESWHTDILYIHMSVVGVCVWTVDSKSAYNRARRVCKKLDYINSTTRAAHSHNNNKNATWLCPGMCLPRSRKCLRITFSCAHIHTIMQLRICLPNRRRNYRREK